MKPAARIAIDMEADSFYHYYEKVCLIQLTIGGKNYILDPLADANLKPFLKLLAQKPLILHDAGYDLRMLRASFDFSPKEEVFDTMLAAQMLGYEKFGLNAMIEHFFDVKLTKAGQRSDWSQRPLTPSQLQYAVSDTIYLESLARKLYSELKHLKRLAWHHESCRSMIKAAAAEKPPADPEDGWRIKGTSKLSRHQLAFIREISKWRISLAQSSDLPPFKIMSNTQIIALAISSANNADSDIPQEIKLPRNCRGRRLSKLKKAIAKANDTPQAKWPKLRKSAPKQRHRPDCKPLIDAIYTKCASLAQQLAIPPHIIAPRAAIINIAYNRPKTTEQIMTAGPLMHWQAQLLKPEITNILSNH